MTQTHTTYRIAINDANLFIDLFEIDLIDSFFLLNLEFHTTSLILSELDPNQQGYIQKFVEIGKLKIREISIAEIETFKDLPVQTQKLSINDLSLYFYALELKECMLLTWEIIDLERRQKRLVLRFMGCCGCLRKLSAIIFWKSK